MLHPSSRSEIHLFINGNLHIIQGRDAFLTFAEYLRNNLSLHGTKVVCAEGDCGACTNMVANYKVEGWTDFQTFNSCITPVYLLDLANVITIEGLSDQNELNTVQESMREYHGAQCGFCTPGIVCSLSCLAEESSIKNKQMNSKSISNHLTGNLCRCTGYQPIIHAGLNVNLSKWKSLASRFKLEEYHDKFKNLKDSTIEIKTNHRHLLIPKTPAQVLKLKKLYPHYRFIAGATDFGVQKNKGYIQSENIIVLSFVDEWNAIHSTNDQISVGAGVTLTQFEQEIKQSHPELHELLKVFASPQIKNRGTLIGNLLNGSPIGDTIPAMFAYGAKIELQSVTGQRMVPIENFYKGYKKFDLLEDEVATAIIIPKLPETWKTRFYKVSVRKDLDISNVTFAAALEIENELIKKARIALGGVGPVVSRLENVESFLKGKRIEEATFITAGDLARKSIKPISDLRASSHYRFQVTENLFIKCFHELNSTESLCQ